MLFKVLDREIFVLKFTFDDTGGNVQKWTRVFLTPCWVILVARTRQEKAFEPDSIVGNKNRVFKSVTNLLQFTKKHSCPKIEAEKYDEESAGKTLYFCIQPQPDLNKYFKYYPSFKIKLQ